MVVNSDFTPTAKPVQFHFQIELRKAKIKIYENPCYAQTRACSTDKCGLQDFTFYTHTQNVNFY